MEEVSIVTKKTEDVLEQRKKSIYKKLFFWVEDKYDKIFLFILAIAFSVRLWIFSKTINQPLWWDTATYLATAKKWGLGLNVNDVWYYRRGFFWPLFGAVFFRTGLGEVGIRFATVLFSTGIVFVSYFLIRDMFNKRIALFTSLIMSFSWVYLFFAGRPMTSTPAAFFILLALLFFWRGYTLKQGNKYLYLFAVFFALAVFTRMQYLMFAPAFLLYIFVKERFSLFKNKSLWIALIFFLLMLTPQIIVYTQNFGNPINDILTYTLRIPGLSSATGEVGSGRVEIDWFMMFKDLPYALTKPIFVLFLIGSLFFLLSLFIGFDKIFKNENIQKKFLILLWICIPLFALSYISPYPEQRYIMPLYPFLFAITTIPLFKLQNSVSKHFKLNKRVLLVISFLILLLLVTYPNMAFTKSSPSNLAWSNSLINIKLTSYTEVMQAGIWIKQNSNPDDIVISTSFPQIAYYSERSTFTAAVKGRAESRVEQTEEEFDEFVKLERPKYYMISVFQPASDWEQNYPQKHQDTLIPVQAYYQNEQPILIIYEFQYPN